MTTTIKRQFSGGEIAPSLYARVDQSKYASGARTLRNFIVLRHGGVSNRPGTSFISEVKDSAKLIRLIPFVFNTAQTYALEFGDLYMRVFKDGVQQRLAATTITGATQANPVVITSASHGYSNGDEVFISGVVGMTELNNRNFKVASVTANTYELQDMSSVNLDGTAFTAYVSGGTAEKVFEIVTPYTQTQVADLNFVQSADVVTIVHPSHAPRDLARTGDTAWTLTTITFAPTQVAPTSPAVTGTAGSNTFTYHITSISDSTGEESTSVSVVQGSLLPPSSADPHSITWVAASGATTYNVYRELNGFAGFIGVAGATSFTNTGIPPDTTDTVPTPRDPFPGASDFPSTVAYYQQRRIFANTDNSPETVFTSRTALFPNFTTSLPVKDSDAITFTMVGRQVNQIKHLVDLGTLVIFSSGGEWTADGNDAGVLLPSSINLRQQSYNGSSGLSPIIIGNNALYVQQRGSIIRDLGFDFQVDGYRGNDLTIFAAHLFDKFTLKDWTYQQIPNSIVWVARSDGKLLGLTYVLDHQIWGWHEHDFEDGTVENVLSIPEGDEDGLYLLIKRTIDGTVRRYIERFNTRFIDDIVDSIFMDSALSFDGRNTTAKTVTISGGPPWTSTTALTLTASTAEFASTDVGNAYHITGPNSELIRFTITAFTSSTVVTGKPHKTVPASMQGVAFTAWTRAVDEVSGLWHLEGKTVSILGDGFVVASPNNPANVTKTVVLGKVTLDRPYGVIHVGLPFTSDIETLDIDTVDGETIVDKKKLISKLSIFIESSRGIWVGREAPATDGSQAGLREVKIRSTEDYDSPVSLKTDVVDINLEPTWNSNGRIFIRQIDPIPLSVLAVAPAGLLPFRG